MAEINLSDIAAGTGGFVVNGECADKLSGLEVAGAGDINGDGLDDLVIGTVGIPNRTYVVFGTTAHAPIDLSNVAAGTGGFLIDGELNAVSKSSVAVAGDVNGDGLADILIGWDSDVPGGRTYVVFGQSGTATIELSAITAGSGGFVIDGECGVDRSGYSVDSAGDVNGDGLEDLLIGAFHSNANAGTNTGRSYVVFGRSDTGATGNTPVELSAVAAGTGGFAINGESSGTFSGGCVAGAGDVNGDGLADLIVAAPIASTPAGPSAGRTYVVFGRTGASPVDLSAVAAGTGGFVINGECAADTVGFSVSDAGDVNGDGLADVIVGGSHSVSVGNHAGRSYVVFGHSGTSAIDLSAVADGTGGFVINGQGASDRSGSSVAGAGDVNGDGLADLIVGAKDSDPAAGDKAGRTYIVFGRSETNAVDLSDVAAGTGGFVINGQCADDYSGRHVAGAGDINGDGLADLIVGATGGDPAGLEDAGRSYVIFGSTTGAFFQTAVDELGTGGDDALTGTSDAETLVGGAGNDTLAGNGGADVLYGGSGNDSFILDSSNIAALSADLGAGGNVNQLSRVDGGTGIDTIVLSGGGVDLDLRAISNQSRSTHGSASRLESIERIDLTGSGDNTLTVGYGDVLDMAGMNLINAGTMSALGWANGSYTFGEVEGRHQLVVSGDAGDAVSIGGGNWTSAGTVTHDGETYTVYNSDTGLAQVLVADAVTQTVQAPIELSDIAAGTGGFVINGECADDRSGFSVSGAGDVNGDGLDDLIVGAAFSDRGGRNARGLSYVVFGTTDGTAIELAEVAAGTGGFVISGECAADFSGWSVAGAGDVNGDGLGDLIVGALENSPPGGRSYVVFGTTETGTTHLSAIAAGTGGFVINGECAGDSSGFSVSGAGDVNGDGRADLIVGARHSDPDAGSDAGRSYVVFGTDASAAVDLSAVAAGTGGFVINGRCANDSSGDSVAGAGDVNGDGLADLIVGAPGDDPAGVSHAGRSYVVFGATSSTPIDLSDIANGTGGFVVNGGASESSGFTVAGAGDVNGDGLADLIVRGYKPTSSNGGRSYVVFGTTRSTPIDLSAIANGTGGFVINGPCTDNRSGYALAGAGDVNGDGLADLIVGARYSYSAPDSAGRTYIVFGRSETSAVDLLVVAAGTGGFAINGQCERDHSGTSVAGAGDINGDGLADLIVGARYSDPAARDWAGRSYVIFGSTTGAFAQTAVDHLGGSTDDSLTGTGAAETLVGGSGNDTLTGNGGADVLYGGAGDDRFVLDDSNLAALAAGFGDAGNTTRLARVDGGTGIDTLALAGGGLDLDLRAIARPGASLPGSYSRLEGIERIELTGGGTNTLTLALADVLDLSDTTNTLMVDGNAGDGVTITKAGSAAVNSVAGYHRFTKGGATLQVDKEVAITLIGAGGGDALTGTSSADTMLGRSGNDAITAAGGSDALEGGDGNDLLEGGSGNDVLNGGAGNDVLNGGTGNDRLTGGTGNDTYVVNTAADRITETAADGKDLVQSSATSYTLRDHTENLTLTGSGNIDGTGNAEANAITGNAGRNALSGAGGNDTLNGAAGNDTLSGGSGNDVLKGLNGADVLTGGSGADRFDYDAPAESGTTAATRDRITDFSHAQHDRIDLSTMDANTGVSGNQKFQFIGGAAFSGNATGKLRFDAATHTLFGSTDADHAAEFSIVLPDLDSMVAGDFIL